MPKRSDHSRSQRKRGIPRGRPRPWEAYDPAWLVRLAQERVPEDLLLQDALRECTFARQEDATYWHFVGADHPNPERREWRFDRTEILKSTSDGPTSGDVAIDILEGGQIGGIEFV